MARRIALVLVIAFAAAGCGGGPTSGSTSGPTSEPSSTSTTSANKAAVVAYATAAGNLQPILDADNQVSAACGAGNVAGCRAGLQGVVNAIDVYTKVLDALSVPACLQQTDRDLRLGMALEKQGAQQGISGLDAGDSSQLVAGAGLITQGNTSIEKASSGMKNSTC